MMESINGQCLCLVRLSGKVGDEVAIFENHCWFVLSELNGVQMWVLNKRHYSIIIMMILGV